MVDGVFGNVFICIILQLILMIVINMMRPRVCVVVVYFVYGCMYTSDSSPFAQSLYSQ